MIIKFCRNWNHQYKNYLHVFFKNFFVITSDILHRLPETEIKWAKVNNNAPVSSLLVAEQVEGEPWLLAWSQTSQQRIHQQLIQKWPDDLIYTITFIMINTDTTLPACKTGSHTARCAAVWCGGPAVCQVTDTAASACCRGCPACGSRPPTCVSPEDDQQLKKKYFSSN